MIYLPMEFLWHSKPVAPLSFQNDSSSNNIVVKHFCQLTSVHNILVKRTYLNSFLFSNLASDGYVSIQTQYWHQIRETTQQAVLAHSLGVLTESVARNDKAYDTCKRDRNRWEHLTVLMGATSPLYMLSHHWSIQRARYSTPETSLSVWQFAQGKEKRTPSQKLRSKIALKQLSPPKQGFTGGMRTCANTTARAGAAYRTLSWLFGNSNMAIDILTCHTLLQTLNRLGSQGSSSQ